MLGRVMPRPVPYAPFARRLSALSLGLMLLGCAGGSDPATTPEFGPAAVVDRPVDELYNEAMDLTEEGRYGRAADAFLEVERQHPYSPWATRAQLMAAYVYYENNAYDEAIAAAERFIQLHPGNKDVPYAYYLIGISYYERISDVGRDQAMTGQALQALTEIVRRFPDSSYARDARLKIDLTQDHLAGKEMAIGRYYEVRGDYLAAVNRFRNVVENYQTTTHVPEALHRLTESYLGLGMIREARRSAAVLGHNFPGSDWYADSYALLAEGGDDPAAGVRPAAGGGSSWLGRLFGAS